MILQDDPKYSLARTYTRRCVIIYTLMEETNGDQSGD
jgi:hypothetical protein